MRYGGPLRHTPLLVLLFGALLVIGIFHAGLFDDMENSRQGEVRELSYEEHGLWTLLFMPRTHWRTAPLPLDRHEFPHVSDAFVGQYINRTQPPRPSDVRDARTLVSSDFLEQMQLLRRPGSNAAQASKLLEALTHNERVLARAEAVRARKRKSWKTRRSSTSPWSPLTNANNNNADRNDVGKGHGAAKNAVVVHYPRSYTLHYTGSSNTTFSFSSNDVQLVPYPWIPPPAAVPHSNSTQNEKHEERKSAAGETLVSNANTASTITVTIPKGKISSSVSHRVAAHQPTHGWDRFYIAVNFWKNEDVLPDFTEALVVFLEEEIKPFFDLETSVVVSIFASISPDRTAELISTLLIPRLHAAGVRRVYATTEGACLGYVERQPFHERIEWMACIRNKALQPLYKKGIRLFSRSPREEQAGVAEGDAEGLVVLFFNDIFFRPQDITKLLESRAEPRIAASTRPDGWIASQRKTDFETSGGAESSATTTTASPHHATSKTKRGTTFDMACGMDFYFSFYDTWVARDRLGDPFEGQMPYSRDHATQDAFYRILKDQRSGSASPKAYAIPVKCCWNGVAAVRGRLFLSPTPSHRRAFPALTSTTATHASSGHSTDVLQDASGALYDRIGNVQDLLNKTEIAYHYVRVLARRLHWVCTSWSQTRGEIAELADVSFYKPETCNHSNSFEGVLKAVLEDEKRKPFASDADWGQLRLELINGTFPAPPVGERGAPSDAVVEAAGTRTADTGGSHVLHTMEDSVYYRARYPSLRFRHSFTPSYGATVAGLSRVRDDVCLSSECLLICQDIMHAALLQDERAPVILLNPLVRVAYTHDNFQRIMRNAWYYENPYVYWSWALLQRIRLFRPSAFFANVDTNSFNYIHRRMAPKASSATDDWLLPTSVAAASIQRKTSAYTVQNISLQDGDGQVRNLGRIDIPTLTQMSCDGNTESSIESTMGSLFPLFRVFQLLLVAVMLWWLCCQVERDMVLIAQWERGGDVTRPNKAEEPWGPALYQKLWPFKLVRLLWMSLGRWNAGDVSFKSAERVHTFLSCAYGHIVHLDAPFAATASQLLRRLCSHGYLKKMVRRIIEAARRFLSPMAHTLLWLLHQLCYFSLWRGALSAPKPGPNPHEEQRTEANQSRSHTSIVLVFEPDHQPASSFLAAPIGTTGTAGYTITRRSERVT